MVKLNRKWKMYVIHHSHTDIGYTDRQEKIEWHHVQYIKEAIDILNEAYVNGKTQWQGFKWTCESFWCVEKFLDAASGEYKNDFIKYINTGNIGISGNYLNLTDLVSEQVLRDICTGVKKKAKDLGIGINCGMTADINGYGWGYSDILYDNGINNLYSGLHPHHGLPPMKRKQMPFYWETPKGNKILVWVGEQYNIGNELGIANSPSNSYMIQDGLQNLPLNEKTQKRLMNYVAQLEVEDYPFDFVPVTVSSLMTDNAAPSARVIEFINKWNEIHGEQIELYMCTLEELFEEVKKHSESILSYRGDWTDWWADGVGSTPNVVKHFKEAQRKYEVCKMIDPENKLGDKALMDEACYNLLMYSEHTWGYSASITQPWDAMVNTLDLRKTSLACKANEAVWRNLDKITANKGETAYRIDKEIKLKVINPFDRPTCQIGKFRFEIILDHDKFEIIDEASNESLPYQIESHPRGLEINVLVNLKAKEEKTLILKDVSINELISSGTYSKSGCEGVIDLESTFNNEEMVVNEYRIETPFFRIEFEENEGIVSFYDKQKNRELLRNDRKYNAFTPVYETTPIEINAEQDRRRMGRNRNARYTERYQGILKGVKVISEGSLLAKVELKYQLNGTSYYTMMITAYKHMPRVDISIRMNKDSVWAPENLYIALPFTTGSENEEMWIDKTASILRPRIDQLPKTCVDFYAIQNGVCYVSEDDALIVAMPDTPLIHIGDLKAHEIKLCGEENVKNNDELYSWVMNNFWETNFKASLGGFHEYNYSICLSDAKEPKQAFDVLKEINYGVVNFTRYE